MAEGAPSVEASNFSLDVEGTPEVLRAMHKEIPGAVTACIALGGGANSIVAPAELSALRKSGLQPDILVGSSASAAPIMYHAANQIERVISIFEEWCVEHPFVHPRAFFKNMNRPPADVDALCDVIRTSSSLGLNQQAVRDSAMKLFVTATNAETGETELLNVHDEENDLTELVRISAGIPGASGRESLLYKGRLLTDGAVGDPLPIRALRKLFPEITHLLVLPNIPEQEPSFADSFIRLLFKKTNIEAPAIRNTLVGNHARFQKSLQELREAGDIQYLCLWPNSGNTTDALDTAALKERARNAESAMAALCAHI